MDAVINDRGFYTDLELAKAAQELVHIEKLRINADVAALTNGEITSIGQVARIKDRVNGRGHDVKGVGKRSVAAVLAHDPDDGDCASCSSCGKRADPQRSTSSTPCSPAPPKTSVCAAR